MAFNSGKIHYKWSFSIAMLIYQRVPAFSKKHSDVGKKHRGSPQLAREFVSHSGPASWYSLSLRSEK
jgi:hypothetical protein